MIQASVPAPSIKLTSFACPNCGAHATQTWFQVLLNQFSGKNPVPTLMSRDEVESLALKNKANRDEEQRAVTEAIIQHFRQLLNGEPFIGGRDSDPYNPPILENVFVSRCYTCGKVALWLHDRLLYPPTMTGPAPNADLSDDATHDYEEARKIFDLSPRGSAALLRLAIEKICIELKAEGKSIDERIASLVSKGMPPAVQQALDTVRVIGNEAVHPGQLDLRDDRDTASKLFDLVNFIAEDRITRPKQVAGLYNMIPEEKRKAIEARNAKASGK